ncbi:two-component sensor histidine kinase [Niastella yeongjuensis]|uniref:Oxygen sensor histidine kinase NreB n=2 Tax=Niastella yeongjuensis TaxID=354355 RepID=A0A1V9F2X1_9BACT|nr:two-component sensor histidine kinase [Niastella yeongjuensis]SEP33646.1 Tetratricopeptide repeat-containing protein [Niastella yeongjuensis]
MWRKNSIAVRLVCLLLLPCCMTLFSLKALSQGAFSENNPQTIVTGTQQLNDTTSINAVIKKADGIREQVIDSALVLYNQAMRACQLHQYNYGMAKALFGISRCYNNKEQKESSVFYARQALNWCPNDIRGHELIASVYLALSEIYYYQNRYDSCSYYRYTALRELENNKVTNPRAQIGVLCSILQFWLNAHEDIHNDLYIREVVQRINNIERNAQATNDSSLLLKIYFHKGGYYNNIGQNDSARYYCERHLQLGQALKASPSMTIATLLNIGLTYMDDKRPEAALQYYKKALAEIPEQRQSENRYVIFANIFQGEAYAMQHDWKKAIAITEPALAEANNFQIMHLSDHAHKTLADAYEALGQYKKANEHRKQYSLLRDSVQRIQKLEMMYDMEVKYRLSDKDKQLAQQELAIERNESRLKTKNFWIIAISASFILILAIGVLIYRNNYHKQTLQAEKIRNLRQEIQIASLQAMVNGEEKERSRIARELHDGIGGTLGAIRTRVSAMVRKYKTAHTNDDFTELMQMLEEASADLRKTAHNLMPEILLQEGLAKASLLFCERLRKGHSLQINTEIWGKVRRLPGDVELTAYRIIQELMHNMLKHAGATQALVQIVFHESQLCITVEDNGRGMPADDSQGEGIGLRTIRERVKLLNGQIDTVSTPGEGTSVYIELNLAATNQTKQL